MAFRSPLPGSRARINREILGQRTLDGRMHSALFNAREERRERFRRAGTGHADASHVVNPGTGISPPLVGNEDEQPVTLVLSLEFAGAASYPSGTLLDTGVYNLSMGLGGAITLFHKTTFITTSRNLSDPTIPGGGVPPSGVHTIAAVLDTVGSRIGLYVDGHLVSSVSNGDSPWSSGTWEYMNAVTNAGTISRLEVFVGFVPSSFGPV